jgi:hypothetical protein
LLPAIMVISAPAISLADRPRTSPASAAHRMWTPLLLANLALLSSALAPRPGRRYTFAVGTSGGGQAPTFAVGAVERVGGLLFWDEKGPARWGRTPGLWFSLDNGHNTRGRGRDGDRCCYSGIWVDCGQFNLKD